MISEVHSNDTILVTGTDALPGFASHKLLLEEGILNHNPWHEINFIKTGKYSETWWKP